jgi:ATPase components of ABC transporters with duplicated ATPase domains
MISIQNVKKRYGRQILFDDLSISFVSGQRIGLIGANGSGKTTLLRLIMGVEKPDAGVVAVPADCTIGHLPQEVEVLGARSPLSIVLEPFEHLLNVEDAYESIARSLADREGPAFKKAMGKIDKLQNDLEYHDVFSLVSRAKSILAGLGVPSDKWEGPVSALSGGYRMRVVLGRLLLMQPRVLLLDEPTNHLDLDSLIWLEKFLERFSGTIIAVSHDREFLNRMTRATAEIQGGRITVYKGNYDGYMAFKAEREASLKNTTRNLERKIAQTERFIERFRAKATKASAVQSRVKLCESLREELPVLPENTRTIHFSFPLSRQSGGVPLKIEHLSVAYDGTAPVFSDLGFTVTRGDKIAVVGPNGTGKTTLLKVLAQQITPVEGTVTIGHNADIRYFGQHVLELLQPHKTLFETIADVSGSGERTYIQNVLGAFLFSGEDVNKTVSVLSGGEKSRLALATILSKTGNVLILDEPTNHLDIQSIEILASALEDFTGTVIFVSHNEYFISRIANRIMEMRPGVFRDFSGTIGQYHSYLEAGYLKDEDAAVQSGASSVKSEASDKQKRMKTREARKQLDRKIEKIENEIGQKEREMQSLAAILHDPANSSNFGLLHETLQKLETVKKKNEELMGEWEALQEMMEE